MGYLSFITTPITQIYQGTLKLLGEASVQVVNFGRSYIFGDLPELMWHGFNRDWILDECYQRMKNTPERVGMLVVGPYLAPNYQLATLVMAPVPVIASYGENPIDSQAREPFQVMEAAIKKKPLSTCPAMKPFMSAQNKITLRRHPSHPYRDPKID